MERPPFHPHKIYKTFRSLIPHNSIGLRGQPIDRMENTIANGFDKARHYSTFKLDRDWNSMRRGRKDMHAYFDMARNHSYRSNRREKPSISDYLTEIQQDPGPFSALLLFNFTGIRASWYIHFKLGIYPKHKVPKKYKWISNIERRRCEDGAGTITEAGNRHG